MSSLIPKLSTPKWKRTFQSHDIAPTPLPSHTNNPCTDATTENEGDKINSTTNTTTIICPTCQKNEARYTCPRCDAPYCSYQCYRIHDIPFSQQNSKRKIIDIIGNDTNDDNGNVHNCDDDHTRTVVSGGKCTEGFYKDRVISMNRLHVVKNIQNQQDINSILSKSFNNYHNTDTDGHASIPTTNNHDHGDDNEQDYDIIAKDNNNQNDILSDDEILILIEYINYMENQSKRQSTNNDQSQNNFHDAHEQFGNIPPPSVPQYLFHKFENLVRKGQISDLIGDQWHPFWIPQYITSTNTIIETEGPSYKNDNDSEDEHEITKLFKIPHFYALQPSYTHPNDMNQPQLQYNAIELLYQTAYILRLYNGLQTMEAKKNISQHYYNYSQQIDSNQDEGDDVEQHMILQHDAAITLYSMSFVLSKDMRYESISHVLMDCTNVEKYSGFLHLSTMYHDEDDNNANETIPYLLSNDLLRERPGGSGGKNKNLLWNKTLIDDLIHISRYTNTVVKVLMKALKIVKAGCKAIRKGYIGVHDEYTHQNNSNRISNKSNSSLDNYYKELKMASKKIEYYASWSKSYWNMVDITQDILEWKNDWCNDGYNSSDNVEDLIVPPTNVNTNDKMKKDDDTSFRNIIKAQKSKSNSSLIDGNDVNLISVHSTRILK